MSHAILFSRRRFTGYVLWPAASTRTGSLLGRINRRSENIHGQPGVLQLQLWWQRSARDEEQGGETIRGASNYMRRMRVVVTFEWQHDDDDDGAATTWTTMGSASWKRPRAFDSDTRGLRMKEKKDKQRQWLGASILSIEITFWCSFEK